jgi:hypothetical protein
MSTISHHRRALVPLRNSPRGRIRRVGHLLPIHIHIHRSIIRAITVDDARCRGAAGVVRADSCWCVRVDAGADWSFLTFLNAPAPGAPLLEPPRLTMAFGGRSLRAVVDTGSTGVVVSADAIPNVGRLRSLEPGELTYSSSGRIMIGTWVVVTIRIGGATGMVETDPIPVLAVTAIHCTPAARRCTAINRPRDVAMLGIGFGREHARTTQSTPDCNPLLRIAALPVARVPGYVLTTRGVAVGAPRQPTGFALVRLLRDAASSDWRAPSACIIVAATPPACGSLLVDTGIAGMFLTMPEDRLAGVRSAGQPSTLVPGTRITVDLLNGVSRSENSGYSITVGNADDPVTPATVMLAGIGRRPTFVNTGVRLLNRYDLLFNAEAGIIGFRPLG